MKQRQEIKPARFNLEEETIRVTRANLPRLVKDLLPLAMPDVKAELLDAANARLSEIVSFCVPSGLALSNVIGHIREQVPGAKEALRLETTLLMALSRKLLDQLQDARRLPLWEPNLMELDIDAVYADAMSRNSRSGASRTLLSHLFVGSKEVANSVLGRIERQLSDTESGNLRNCFLLSVVELLHAELEHYHSQKVQRRRAARH